MPAIDDFFAELSAVRTYSARRQQAAAEAQSYTRSQVENMTLAARMWPSLRPGALLALGKGNYRADHPLAQQLADMSARLYMHDHPNGIRYGESTRTPAMQQRRNQAALANQAVNYARGQAERRAGLIAPPDISDEDIEQRVAQYAEGDVDPEAVQAFRSKLERERVTYKQRLSPSQDVDEGGFIGELQQATGTAPSRAVAVRSAGATEIAETAFTAPIRSGFMALDAPYQELIQGQARNLYALAHGDMPKFWEPQSDIGVLISGALTGGPTDTGSGYFIDQESEVAKERRERERERGQIGGHNVTIGRWMVDGLLPVDPNARGAKILSGLVDTAAAMYLDPSARFLGQAGKARGANQLFALPEAERGAGVVKGLRWMVNQTDGARYLDSDEGQLVLDVLARTKSPAAIRETTNRKWPMELYRKIGDEASTPEAVRAILEPELGTRIRRVSDVTPLTGGTARMNPLKVMPARGGFDPKDEDKVAWEIEAQMRNAGAPREDTHALIDKVARAEGNPFKLTAAVRDANRDVRGVLDQMGVGAEARDRITRIAQDTHKSAQDTFRAQHTAQTPTYNNLVVNGEPVNDSGAGLWSELVPNHMSIADARAVRRNVAHFPTLLGRDPIKAMLVDSKTGKVRLPTLVADYFVNDIWKPLQLIRPAWMVRVIGEEQLRMAAAGYDSMFNHPASYISWVIGRNPTDIPEGTLAKLRSPFTTTKALAGKGARQAVVPAGEVGVVPNEFLDESHALKTSMSVGHGNWTDHAQVPTGMKTTFFKSDVHRRDLFRGAFASEILTLHADPVANRLANSATMDDAMDWFTSGAGNRFRGDLAVSKPGKYESLDQARAYLEIVQQRIDTVTGGNSSLLAAVKTGKLDGEDLLAGANLNPAATERLDGYIDDFAPDEIIGEETKMVSDGVRGELRQRIDRFTESAFSMLMTQRTNNLSRSPVFKQAYWREVNRLMDGASPEARATILSQADAANLPKRQLKGLNRRTRGGELNLDEIDLMAKAHGLDETKTLLYDLSTRGRFMDAARLIFPFGEAWTEMVTRWFGKPKRGGWDFSEAIVANHPQTVRRFQQVMQASRGEDFGEVMGAPEGKGFFWKNTFGEEVFTYPGIGILTEKIMGTPIPMTGRVQGLNMFGNMVPGLGPAVQIPAGWILANKPGPQILKEWLGKFETFDVPGPLPSVGEMLLPFGSPGQADEGELFSATTYMPPWMKSLVDVATQGGIGEKAYGDAVMAIAAYKRSSGDYGNGKDEMQRLMEDARNEALGYYVVKMLGQAVLPAAPAADWQVIAKDDRSVSLRAVSEELAKLRQEDFETADQTFLNRYGPDLLAALTPKTGAVEYGIPVTKEGAQWVLEHPGIEDDLPHTYGFFAPAGGEFDYSLYDRQLREGDRVQLDGDVWSRLMNHTNAMVLLNRAKESVGDDIDTDDGREFMAGVKSELDDRFPGWDDMSGTPKRPELFVMIRELDDALKVDAIRDTDAGKALALYMAARAQVKADFEANGYKQSNGLLSQAAAVEDGHVALREYGTRLVRNHPGFEALWDVVLSRELEEVEQ